MAMNRIFVVGGAWSMVLVIGGLCWAADQKRQGNQPAPQAPPPANTPGFTPGGGMRYIPPNKGNTNTNPRAAEAAAARAAAAARNSPPATPVVPQPTAPSPNRHYYPSGYPYGGYGYYAPYGYPYSPYGTTQYVLGYDPYTGQTFLYPYSGGYTPYGYSPYGYSPYGYSPYGYRYPYYGNPYLGFGYPSAVFVNPGQLFGLGPIQQLMGAYQGFGPQQNAAPFANANPNPPNANNNNPNPGLANGNNPRGNAAANVPEPPQPHKSAAGSKAMELGWKFITFGDARFGELKYSDALDRYRRAARECPTLGDAWFREGFALAAMGKYDQAAKAMRRGLEEKPDWADTNFRLDDIYGDNAADKKARVDGMVKAAEGEPTNGDLALVVGIHLYCDGKTDQAAPFFRRAAQILGDDANIKPFLNKAE
jgi:tetratricopeptide (TPR) repeat protein